MDIQQRHQIEHECERLEYQFLRLFEHEHSKVADLFTEDGVLAIEQTRKGRDVIREAMLEVEKNAVREVGTLIATNVIVDVIDENNARGESHLLHYKHVRKDEKDEGPWPLYDPLGIYRWVAEYKHVNGEWKIAHVSWDFIRLQGSAF